MRPLAILSVLVGAVVSPVLGQLIEIGSPASGTKLFPGDSFVAQIVQPGSPISCIQVGIALSIASCDLDVCPTADEGLGNVLYAGPWTPHSYPAGTYQNFTLQVPGSVEPGPAIFSVTHLCLIGAGPFPVLQFVNVSLSIAPSSRAIVNQLVSQ